MKQTVYRFVNLSNALVHFKWLPVLFGTFITVPIRLRNSLEIWTVVLKCWCECRRKINIARWMFRFVSQDEQNEIIRVKIALQAMPNARIELIVLKWQHLGRAYHNCVDWSIVMIAPFMGHYGTGFSINIHLTLNGVMYSPNVSIKFIAPEYPVFIVTIHSP